jgi:hypothetical protein
MNNVVMDHTLIYMKKHIYANLGHHNLHHQDHGAYLPPFFLEADISNVNIEEYFRGGNEVKDGVP